MTPPKGTRPSIQYTLKESMKKILKTILPLWLLAIIRRIRSSKTFDVKYRFEMRESKRILRGISSGDIAKVVIVYDILASPPTPMESPTMGRVPMPAQSIMVDAEAKISLNVLERRKTIGNIKSCEDRKGYPAGGVPF